ncbi:MAG: phage tail tape measure protein [Thermofilaceae archaeon]
MPEPIASAYVELSVEEKAFISGLKKAETQFLSFVRNLTSGILVARSFIRELDSVSRAIGVVAVELGTTTAQARTFVKMLDDLRRQFGVTREEAVATFTTIEDAGYTAEEALLITEKAMQLAVATGSNLVRVAQILASYMAGLDRPASEASEAVNELFLIMREGMVNIDDLDLGFYRLITGFKSVGLSARELIALYTALTKKTSETYNVYLALNGIVKTLLEPSRKLQVVLAELGFTSLRAAIEQMGLFEALKLILQQIERGKLAWTDLITDVRALSGIAGLLGAGIAEAERLLAELNKGTIDVSKGAEIMKNTWEVAVDRLKASISALRATVLTPFIEAIIGFLDFLTRTAESFRKAFEMVITLGMRITPSVEIDRGAFGKIITVLLGLGPLGAILAKGVQAFLTGGARAATSYLGTWRGLLLLDLALNIAFQTVANVLPESVSGVKKAIEKALQAANLGFLAGAIVSALFGPVAGLLAGAVVFGLTMIVNVALQIVAKVKESAEQARQELQEEVEKWAPIRVKGEITFPLIGVPGPQLMKIYEEVTSIVSSAIKDANAEAWKAAGHSIAYVLQKNFGESVDQAALMLARLIEGVEVPKAFENIFVPLREAPKEFWEAFEKYGYITLEQFKQLMERLYGAEVIIDFEGVTKPAQAAAEEAERAMSETAQIVRQGAEIAIETWQQALSQFITSLGTGQARLEDLWRVLWKAEEAGVAYSEVIERLTTEIVNLATAAAYADPSVMLNFMRVMSEFSNRVDETISLFEMLGYEIPESLLEARQALASITPELRKLGVLKEFAFNLDAVGRVLYDLARSIEGTKVDVIGSFYEYIRGLSKLSESMISVSLIVRSASELRQALEEEIRIRKFLSVEIPDSMMRLKESLDYMSLELLRFQIPTEYTRSVQPLLELLISLTDVTSSAEALAKGIMSWAKKLQAELGLRFDFSRFVADLERWGEALREEIELRKRAGLEVEANLLKLADAIDIAVQAIRAIRFEDVAEAYRRSYPPLMEFLLNMTQSVTSARGIANQLFEIYVRLARELGPEFDVSAFIADIERWAEKLAEEFEILSKSGLEMNESLAKVLEGLKLFLEALDRTSSSLEELVRDVISKYAEQTKRAGAGLWDFYLKVRESGYSVDVFRAILEELRITLAESPAAFAAFIADLQSLASWVAEAIAVYETFVGVVPDKLLELAKALEDFGITVRKQEEAIRLGPFEIKGYIAELVRLWEAVQEARQRLKEFEEATRAVAAASLPELRKRLEEAQEAYKQALSMQGAAIAVATQAISNYARLLEEKIRGVAVPEEILEAARVETEAATAALRNATDIVNAAAEAVRQAEQQYTEATKASQERVRLERALADAQTAFAKKLREVLGEIVVRLGGMLDIPQFFVDLVASFVTGTLDPLELLFSALSWILDLLAGKLNEATRALERARATLEKFTNSLLSAIDALWNMIKRSEPGSALLDALNRILGAIIDSLLGFLWPLVAILQELGFIVSSVGEIEEELSATASRLRELNVPAGFKELAMRLEYLVARPGEPYVPEPEERRRERKRRAEIEIPEWAKKIAETLANFVAQLEPILTQIISGLTSFAQAIAPTFAALFLSVLQTFLGAISEIVNFLNSTAAPIINAIFSRLAEFWRTQVDPFIRSQVIPVLLEWLEGLLKFIRDRVVPFLENYVFPFIAEKLWPKVEEILPKLLALFEDVLSFLEKNWPTISDFILRLMDQWLNDLQRGLDLWKADLLARSGDIWGALKLIWESESLTFWDKIVASMQYGIPGFIAAIVGIFQGIGEGISNFLVSLFEGAGKLASGLWEFAMRILEGGLKFFALIWDYIVGAIINIAKEIGEGVGNFIKFIFEAAGKIGQTVGEILGKFFETAASIVWKIAEFIGSVIGIISETIFNALGTIGNFIGNLISTILNALTNAVGAIANFVGNVISTVWNTLANVVGSIANFIGNVISTIWNGLTNAVSTLSNFIGNAIATIWNTLSSTVSMIANWIANVISVIANTIYNILGMLINGVANFVSTLISEILGLGGKILDAIWSGIKWFLGLFGIHLQEGGIVTKPTLAIVGEAGPEIVMPLPEFEALISAQYGASELNLGLAIENHIRLEVDGRQLAYVIKETEIKEKIVRGKW